MFSTTLSLLPLTKLVYLVFVLRKKRVYSQAAERAREEENKVGGRPKSKED